MSNKGTLFLIPNLISADSDTTVLSQQTGMVLSSIRHFLAEDVRTARRFFGRLELFEILQDLDFAVLDKETPESEMNTLCKPLTDGHNMGVISESGCPGVADPGGMAVNYAHHHGIKVVPLAGPSSVVLALMASGLNGQRFAFNGYLPIDSKEISKSIKEMERESRNRDQTQIFIETPYRNNTLLQHLIRNLSGDVQLCVAIDLTGSSENIVMKRIAEWKRQAIALPKKPAIFLFLA